MDSWFPLHCTKIQRLWDEKLSCVQKWSSDKRWITFTFKFTHRKLNHAFHENLNSLAHSQALDLIIFSTRRLIQSYISHSEFVKRKEFQSLLYLFADLLIRLIGYNLTYIYISWFICFFFRNISRILRLRCSQINLNCRSLRTWVLEH